VKDMQFSGTLCRIIWTDDVSYDSEKKSTFYQYTEYIKTVLQYFITIMLQCIIFARNLPAAMEEVAQILTTHSTVVALRITLDPLVLVSIYLLLDIISHFF